MVAGPLTVVQMLPELESGGVERGTLELAGYLARLGHRSIVISAGGRMVPQLVSEGSEHIQWDVGKKSPMTLRFIPKLRRFLVERQVDILHLRSRMPAWIGYLAWKSLSKNSRPRLVTTFHGFYSVNKYSAVMTKGERVIAISKTISQHIQTEYNIPAEHIELIYRGVDESNFSPSAVSSETLDYFVKKWNLPKERPPVIMLPGRLTRLKGHDVFFRALKKIERLDWLAVCVGDTADSAGYHRDLQNLLGKLQIADRVHFVGHCDNMPAAYLLADIVVSTTLSRPEAFGRIAVEAQAMGKPVIATAHGGSLETVLPNITGWLVPPGSDPDNLADALREALVDSRKRREFGNRGMEWVSRNFAKTAMCEKTLALYNTLLEAE